MATKADKKEKALQLLLRTVTAAQGDLEGDLVLRLREIREAKGDVLADDEYQAFRNMALEPLVDRVYLPLSWTVVFAGTCIVCAILAAYVIWNGPSGAAWVFGCVGALSALWWRGLARDYAAKRAMPQATRLKIIDRLLAEQLISEDEAQEYNVRIRGAFTQ